MRSLYYMQANDDPGAVPMVTEELLNKYVGKIVEAVDPDAVILFGSYARDQASSESDIDLLVIHSGSRLREIQRKAYTALVGRTDAVDLIVRDPDDLRERLQWPDTFVANILREGKVLHAKPHSPGVALVRHS